MSLGNLIKVFAIAFGIIVVISTIISLFNRDKGAKAMNVLLKGLLVAAGIAIISILLTSVTGYNLIQDENGRYNFMKNANILSGTMDLQNDIQSLDFELISEDIKIVTTDSDTFRLEYSWLEWDEKPSISTKGGKLVYKTGEKLRHVVSCLFTVRLNRQSSFICQKERFLKMLPCVLRPGILK